MFMNEPIKEISIDSIVTGGLNPRKTFDPEYIKQLANSIRRDGQWNPIIVRQRSEKYELIAGECRLRAFKKLGLTTIKARVLNMDDDEAHLLALKTNLMRRDLNPVEEACGIRNLIDVGLSIKKIAKDLNKSQHWVHNRLKLAENGTEGLQNAVITRTIPLTYAIIISDLSEGLQGPAVDKIVKDRLNLIEVKKLVNLLKTARTAEELELIFEMPREKLMRLGNTLSEKVENLDNSITAFDCVCGIKYIVDWASQRIISNQHLKKSYAYAVE